jgi:hypothetical protein
MRMLGDGGEDFMESGFVWGGELVVGSGVWTRTVRKGQLYSNYN